MTIAEYLEQQGLERAAQGRQEGRKEEAQRIAVAMLHSGLPRDGRPVDRADGAGADSRRTKA